MFDQDANEILNRMGYEMGECIGDGGSAYVYDVKRTVLPRRLVMKVTRAAEDALLLRRTMIAQRRGLADGLVRVYGVWPEKNDDSVYQHFILAERLDRLDDHHKIQDAFNSMQFCNVAGDPAAPEFWSRWDRTIPTGSFWPVAAALNIREMRNSLRQIGVTDYTDWHRWNVMVRPGYGAVLCDLGCSRYEEKMPEL